MRRHRHLLRHKHRVHVRRRLRDQFLLLGQESDHPDSHQRKQHARHQIRHEFLPREILRRCRITSVRSVFLFNVKMCSIVCIKIV